jgi:hypothetical protein
VIGQLRSPSQRRSVERMRVAVAVLFLALLAAPALAGQRPKPADPEAADPIGTPAPAPLSTGGMPSGMEGRKPTDVLRFEPLVIEGRTQAPQAVRVLKRADVSFSDLLPPESLLPKIAEAVESEPF